MWSKDCSIGVAHGKVYLLPPLVTDVLAHADAQYDVLLNKQAKDVPTIL